MQTELKQKLIYLADKYETSNFYKEDPSQFLNWYSDCCQIEIISFIAAMLSFGSRKQFIPKIKNICSLADEAGGIKNWLLAGDFSNFVTQICPLSQKIDDSRVLANENPEVCPLSQICPLSQNDLIEKKYYRFYSYADMLCLFKELGELIKNYGSLGEYCRINYEKAFANQKRETSKNKLLPPGVLLSQVLSGAFPESAIVPKGKSSANKRIFMYLRWMVRQNSPVDKGLWSWFSPADLIIPLDVHVMQESEKMELIPPESAANLKTAVQLTKKLCEIWPNDPVRADFALFGLGVDSDVETLGNND